MASRKKSSLPTPQEVDLAHRDAAIAIAKSMTRHDKYLQQISDDLANSALKELARAMSREHIHNPDAFMSWKIRNLMYDQLRQRKAEISRLHLWNEEMMAGRGKRIGDFVDTRNHWFGNRGLSLNIITREEEYTAALQAFAMIHIMPLDDDRAILKSRFYQPEMSISDIARQHGDRTPAAMANYLRKLLGTQDTPGALSPARDAIEMLSPTTGTAFCREICFLDDKSLVSDPIGAAIAHFEIASTYSQAHQERAATGIAHLRWIQRNQPTNRGLPNKILNRLIRAACFYVVETNDARHDEYDDLGLHDDVNVVAAVQRAVHKYHN
jgi:hypothetical protein